MSAATSLAPPQKNARFVFEAGIFHITGGDRGIRLHAAGRGLACKPNPSNPSRDVRRDIAGSASKQNAPFNNEAGIFFITGDRGIPIMAYDEVSTSFYGFDC